MEENKNVPIKKTKIKWILMGIIIAIGGLFWGAYFFKDRIISHFDTNLKIGFITDWEYGYKTKVGSKLTDSAPTELQKAVDFFNNKFHPEIVIEGGDMVESSLSKRKTTISQLQEINDIFSKLSSQKGYVMGNHDLRDLNKEEIRNILDISYNHAYFDLGDWRLVIMDTNFRPDGTDRDSDYYVEGFVPESEFNWVREAFQTEKPVILFSHHSPVPVELNGVILAANKNLLNATEVHNFLKQFPNLVLVVSGHDPSFVYNNEDGVNYLIVDNLANVDSVGSFASLEAKYNKYTKKAKMSVEHYGPIRKSFEVEKKIGEFKIRDLWK